MQIGISVTKKVSFRLVQQEFTNVYHYYLLGAETAPYEALLDEVVAAERQWHALDVTFVRGAVWTSGGPIEQNQMMFQKPLSGLGNSSNITSLDRERAVLIRWPAGVDSRGKPVYLRKWYHSCGGFHTVGFGTAQMQNTAEILAADRATIAGKADELTMIGALEAWQLVAESGRQPTGPPECHRFLEHHQLGDMWR